MIPLSLARIAQITGGQLGHGDPGAVVSGEVVVDSRRIGPGGLFAAVAGERSDGHDFAAAAIAQAVTLAAPGDVIVVAGKGHETGQYVAGAVLPFDDRAVTASALERAAKGQPPLDPWAVDR